MGSSNRHTTNNARRLGFASGLEHNISKQLKNHGREFEYESELCVFSYHKPVVNGGIVDTLGNKLDYSLLNIALAPYEGEVDKVVQFCKYTCDFVIWKQNGEPMFIESKGFFKSADRSKHKLLKKQYPDIDLRLLFSNDGLVSKRPRTRYTDWAEKAGIPCHVASRADQKILRIVPKEWLDE